MPYSEEQLNKVSRFYSRYTQVCVQRHFKFLITWLASYINIINIPGKSRGNNALKIDRPYISLRFRSDLEQKRLFIDWSWDCENLNVLRLFTDNLIIWAHFGGKMGVVAMQAPKSLGLQNPTKKLKDYYEYTPNISM